MTDRILLVDDDSNLHASSMRTLGRSFEIETATSGIEGLKLIEASETPFVVIVSDLRMPGMDGIEFLTQVRAKSPDSIRIMLTGFADLQTAMDAVNTGQVFRFLTKPCPMKMLQGAIDAGIAQHRLIRAERELAGLRRLEQAMEGIITGFSALVEARDPYTAGHQKQVTKLALAIADTLGISKDHRSGLHMAAMVHDIGKIYIPADFLNKPGHLTEVEYTIIQTHPQVGCDILKSVDFEWPISKIVLQHHERLDGSGYPDGITGDDILPEAKILSVADVVDAMSSHRPYRPSLGIDTALKEIEANSGSLYDSDVVTACLTLFREKEFSLQR